MKLASTSSAPLIDSDPISLHFPTIAYCGAVAPEILAARQRWLKTSRELRFW